MYTFNYEISDGQQNKAALHRICMDVFESHGYTPALTLMDTMMDKFDLDYEVFMDYLRDEYELLINSLTE